MNKNNLQMIKRFVNLQTKKNLLTKSNIHNYNKELQKKFNNNIIKRIDDNLNKLLSIEKEKQLEKQAYNNLYNKLSLIVFGSSVIFTYYNCYNSYLLLYS